LILDHERILNVSAFSEDDCFLSVGELAARLRAGTVSPVEVVETLARRIQRLDPLLHAFAHLDLEGAHRDAVHLERARQTTPEANLKPLFGVPIAIKDDLGVRGLPHGWGSRLCDGQVAASDDLTVQRLRQAGAIILGKTHLPEFGHKGTTDNRLGPGGARLATATPWDLSRTAGGSSGGSAAAVAAGLAFLALGTDIGGSVRIPASCCGVLGLKPTFGLVPRVPSGNAFTVWTSGVLARSAADGALALRVLAGPDERDRFSLPAPGVGDLDLAAPLPPLTVAWCPNPTDGPVEPIVRASCRAAVERLAGAGVRIVDLGRPLMDATEAYRLAGVLADLFRVSALSEFCAVAGLADRAAFDAAADWLSPSFREFVEPAWDVTLPRYLTCQAELTAFVEERAGPLFDGIDVLATPTLAVLPFDKELEWGPTTLVGRPFDAHLSWFFTWPFNLSGQPALSLPCAWTEGDRPLPIGLQLIGRRGADGLLLRLAASLETLIPARRPPL
jgi:Asp-tRNA(Asn)/Glu-tRNA(Gln) amidotransferase A subunit family amidase